MNGMEFISPPQSVDMCRKAIDDARDQISEAFHIKALPGASTVGEHIAQLHLRIYERVKDLYLHDGA